MNKSDVIINGKCYDCLLDANYDICKPGMIFADFNVVEVPLA
jgi:hypothetical protein